MKNMDKLLEKIINYLDKGESFLSKEMPEFAQQLIDYSAWAAQWQYDISFWFALLFFVLALAFTLKTFFSDNNGDFTGMDFMALCFGFVFLLFFLWAKNSYMDLKMYKIAPKVYLIKTIKNLK